ncbi:MAG: EFR1 family ferrodoxin [Tyzzerella sp.]|nr:EFR1 family ferrodoxin [Tyzzerella sp.]
MILYYTGTGNSAYVAKKIGEKIEDEVLDLFERIRNHDYSEIHSDKPLIFVYPTYGWQMPRILADWIRKTKFTGEKKAYFVATCGSSKGDTDKNLQKLCKDMGFEYRGCAGVQMPENYIAMFPVPDEEIAKKIIIVAGRTILRIVKAIKNDKYLELGKVPLADKICSTVVNKAFYAFIVKAKKFYSKDTCISCGKCEKVCPLSNVTLVDGKPKWGKDCTHCMACICKCPTEAIEYGKASQGKPRYQCPM